MYNDLHSKNKEEIYKELNTSEKGLSSEEAKTRLSQYGYNEITKKKGESKLFLFLKQLNNPLIYILFVAMIISYIFDHVIDAYVILVIVMVNAVIGFVEERKAEKAIDALETLIISYAKVMRDGEIIKVPSKEVVIGDIIFLEAGDKIPADARLIEIENFRTQESSLTGESMPQNKKLRLFDESTPLTDRANMVFMSTLVVSGKAKAIVVSTSNKTAIGQVAESIQAIVRPKIHFNKKVSQLTFQMSIFAIIGALFIFLIGYFINGMDFFNIFIFTISSLVAGIPEGLPAVLIIILAIGGRRMAKRNAVVRHLPAVETLGVANIIATDKTGTLTQNSITVERIVTSKEIIYVTGNGWEPIGKFIKNKSSINPKKFSTIKKTLSIATICNEGKLLPKEGDYEIVGDPTEVSLHVLGKKAGLTKKRIPEKIIDDFPFSAELKFRATLIETESKDKELYSVGAFETILGKCSYYLDEEKKNKLSSEDKKEFLNKATNLAKKGMRVLALAYREMPKNSKDALSKDVHNLVFVALVGMKDPPRPDVKEAIQKARNAGIRVIMKTGDHKETAMAIAKEIGLIDKKSKVLSQTELEKLSELEFNKAVEEVNIFARVTPKMKLKIIKTLQEKGNIVAMTGDGVNDAPALKSADIGISMGIIGTDVARESSEIILTDDNFASIVNAIEEGRIVFRNIKRTSFFLVTTNVAETLTIMGSLIIGPIINPNLESLDYLPLLPIQVLYLNLVTDTFTAIGLSMEPGHKDVLNKPPRDKNEKILNKDLIPFLIITSFLMVIGTLPLFYHYLPQGLVKARTVAFISLSMFQLFNVFNMRSIKRSLFSVGIFTNKWVTRTLILSFGLMLIVVYAPWIRDIFQFVPISIKEFLFITLISSSVFFAGEIYKKFKYKNQKF